MEFQILFLIFVGSTIIFLIHWCTPYHILPSQKEGCGRMEIVNFFGACGGLYIFDVGAPSGHPIFYINILTSTYPLLCLPFGIRYVAA